MSMVDTYKKHVLEKMLAVDQVLVVVDARRPGVVLPAHLIQDSQVVLRLGYALVPPIADLVLGEWQFTATLSFSGQLHECLVPYAAVYVMECGTAQYQWPGDSPLVPAQEVKKETKVEEPKVVSEPKKRHLKLVP